MTLFWKQTKRAENIRIFWTKIWLKEREKALTRRVHDNMLLTEVVDWFPENHCCWTTFIGNYILTICMYMYMYIYIGKYVLQTRILSLSLSISSSSLSLSSPSLWIHRGLGAWGGSRRQRPVKDKIVTRVWRWLLWSSQDLVDALYNDDDKDVDNYYEDMPVHFPIASLWSIRAACVAVLISSRPVWLRPAQVSVHSFKGPRTTLCSRLFCQRLRRSLLLCWSRDWDTCVDFLLFALCFLGYLVDTLLTETKLVAFPTSSAGVVEKVRGCCS